MRILFEKIVVLLFPPQLSRKKGQTLVEYALILAVLTIVCIGAFSLLSNQVVAIFSNITTLLDTAQSS